VRDRPAGGQREGRGSPPRSSDRRSR
jgi:hypothetical protein